MPGNPLADKSFFKACNYLIKPAEPQEGQRENDLIDLSCIA